MLQPAIAQMLDVDATRQLEAAAVADFQSSAMSENTGLAYQSDWRQFTRWCQMRGVDPLPATPMIVAAYLAAQAQEVSKTKQWLYAPSTIGRRLAAITKAHELAGHLSPCRDPHVTTTMAGIRRQRVRPTRRMTPLLLADLHTVLAKIELWRFPLAVIGRRDAALLVMGFAGAFRRSELVALTVDDVTLHAQDGLHIMMRKSKTDQEGRGSIKALPYGAHPDTCPPCVYLRWRQVLDVTDAAAGDRVSVMALLRRQSAARAGSPLGHICRGAAPLPDADGLPGDRPLFRAVHKAGLPGADPVLGQVVGAVVKRRAAAAGIDPLNFAGHSLRAGFVTQAVRGGADTSSIMAQTGHRSHAMVELYRRENAPLIGNAVTTLGL